MEREREREERIGEIVVQQHQLGDRPRGSRCGSTLAAEWTLPGPPLSRLLLARLLYNKETLVFIWACTKKGTFSLSLETLFDSYTSRTMYY